MHSAYLAEVAYHSGVCEAAEQLVHQIYGHLLALEEVIEIGVVAEEDGFDDGVYQ